VLGTLFAAIALVVLVLPGFVTSRLAAGRRATPARIADLELILRAIGYSLVLHTGFALTGWTAQLFAEINYPGGWQHHVSALALFGFAVFSAAAAFGLLLRTAFDKLQTLAESSDLAQLAFHLLGGDDVRDGFDYIFTRRKQTGEDFIVRVQTEYGDGYVGRFGPRSYTAVSPRPHDLYLEEMWEDGPDGPKLGKGPSEGAWFSADSIKEIRFRDLPADEKVAGVTSRLGRIGIDEAIRQERRRFAEEVEHAVPALVKDSLNTPAIERDFERALEQTVSALRDAPRDEAEAGEVYTYWNGTVRSELLELAAIATALTAVRRAELDGFDQRVPSAQYISSEIAMGRNQLRVPLGREELWVAALEDAAHQLRHDRIRYQPLITLVAEAVVSIDNADWDFD
jgi:hypothetical protein